MGDIIMYKLRAAYEVILLHSSNIRIIFFDSRGFQTWTGAGYSNHSTKALIYILNCNVSAVKSVIGKINKWREMKEKLEKKTLTKNFFFVKSSKKMARKNKTADTCQMNVDTNTYLLLTIYYLLRALNNAVQVKVQFHNKVYCVTY